MRADRLRRRFPARPAPALVALLAIATGGCDQVRIGSAESLWLLWLLPALVLFFAYSFSARSRLLRRFATPAMLERLTAGVSRPRQLFKAGLVTVAVLASVLALAGLKYGFTWEEVERRGVDIVVALDVSDSMLVEDAEAGGKLSRLERAKREIADLLSIVGGDRIGLVAFAGTAFLECPLTLDYGAARLFLSSIDTDLIPVKGTALGDALRTSLKAFEGGSHSSRAIILITDGEDHGGDALAAAEEAKLAGVRIFAIGIGRDEGAPIPAPGGGLRRDRRGEIILSRLDEPTLQRIALATGGRYVRSVTGDVDLEQIYSQGIKAVLEDQELESQRRQRWQDRFQWLLALALIALMAEPLVAERRRAPRAEGVPPAALAAGLLLAGPLLAGSPAGAQQSGPPQPPDAAPPTATATAETPPPPPRRHDDPWEAYQAGAYDQAVQGFIDRQVERPDEPALALNLGSAYYGMRDYERADDAFARAALAADPALRQEAIYNLGNSAYRQGRLEDAVALYQRALELDPEDEDAKFNLEFVRDEIRRRIEEARERQEQQQQQQGGEQEEQQQQEPGDQGEQEQQQEGQRQEQADQPEGGGQPQTDSDQDGLPDEVERQGANPTDPTNPDTDGDGLPDGAEDHNASGSVDPGETDPNQVDTDGDGTPDGEEAAAQGGDAEPAGVEAELSPEEAERYLRSLEEGRPDRRAPATGRKRRPAKDW